MNDLLDLPEGAPIAATPSAPAESSTELVVIETLVPAIVFAPGGVDAIIEKLRREVLAIPRDISTPKGRAAVKSLRYRVARSKTALDSLGKELTEDIRRQKDAIDADRRKIREELDALGDAVTADLDKWETSEKDRIKALEDALIDISTRAMFFDAPSSRAVKDRLAELDNIPDRDWREFIQRAVDAKITARKVLTDLLVATEIREAAEAEAIRLADEQEAARVAEVARLLAEHEAEIARQAAESARLEAEAEAARQAEVVRLAAEAEQRRLLDEAEAAAEAARLEAVRLADEAAAERKRIEDKAEADRIAAKELADKLEADRVAAVKRADEAEAKRLADAKQAEIDRRAASDAAETQRLVAERQAELEKQQAIEIERQRVADENKRLADEAEAREKDKENRGRVNSEAKADLVAAGLTDEQAALAIKAIVKKLVRNITIAY